MPSQRRAVPSETPQAPGVGEAPQSGGASNAAAAEQLQQLLARHQLTGEEAHARGFGGSDPTGVFQPRPGERALKQHGGNCCSGMTPGADYVFESSVFLRGAEDLAIGGTMVGDGPVDLYDLGPIDLAKVANGMSPADLVEMAELFDDTAVAFAIDRWSHNRDRGLRVPVPTDPKLYQDGSVPPQFAFAVNELLLSLNYEHGSLVDKGGPELGADASLRATPAMLALLRSLKRPAQ
ncbi:MAG: hypothetical protein ABMA64_32905 [Myxococcota bacterium]